MRSFRYLPSLLFMVFCGVVTALLLAAMPPTPAYADDSTQLVGDAYVTFDSDTETLTFLRDTQKHETGSKDPNNSNVTWYAVDEESTDSSEPIWKRNMRRVPDKVVFRDTIRPHSTANWFEDMNTTKTIEGLDKLDTSEVVTMYAMFYNTGKLTTIDVSTWDTHNVTDMGLMFSNASSLTSIGSLAGWDTGKVTNMSGMFDNTFALTSLDGIENWNTSNVTNISSMFAGAMELTKLDLSNWDTSNVKYMAVTFSGTVKLNDLRISSWDTGNVISMMGMFRGARGITSLDVRNWDTHNVTDMSEMFSQADRLESLDLNAWNTSNVTTTFQMFFYTPSLTEVRMRDWNTSKLTNAGYMFFEASALTDLDLSNWTTSSLTDMSAAFALTSSLRSLNLSNWNTSNVYTMSSAFAKATSLHELTLGPQWKFVGDNEYLITPDHDDTYTGRWSMDIATNPVQKSVEELRNDYPSAAYIDGKAHTWVWGTNVTYSLAYDVNGGEMNDALGTWTSEPTDPVLVPQRSVSTTAVVPTRSGYTFLGWNTKADGTGIALSSGQPITLEALAPAATLFAQWEPVHEIAPDSPKPETDTGAIHKTSVLAHTGVDIAGLIIAIMACSTAGGVLLRRRNR